LFTAATGYLFKIYVARALGAEALGICALGATLIGFLGVANGLGLPQAATRFVAEYSAGGQSRRLHFLLRRMTVLVLGANAVLAIALLAGGPWFASHVYHAPTLAVYLPLFAGLLMLGGMTDFCGRVLAGYKAIATRTVLTNFIGSPLCYVGGIAALSAGFALRGYLYSQLAAGAIVLVLLITAVWRLTPSSSRGGSERAPSVGREVIHFSMAALGISFLEFILSQADKVVLGIYSNVRNVGIYAVAATLVAFVPVLLQSVNQIFSPTIADLYTRGEHVLLGRLFQTLTKWVTGLTLPLAFVFMIYSKQIMLMFGPAFGVGWAVLMVGTVGQIINTGVGPVGYLLMMSGNQGRLIRVQALMSIFMVVAALVLVKPFGMLGIAGAAALTNAVSNFLYLREVRAALGFTPYNRTYLLLVPSAFAALGITFAIKLAAQHVSVPRVEAQWLGVLISLLISYGAFCGLALMFGLDADDKMILHAVRDRIRGVAGSGVGPK
jgi:O-antigen/teichoic acid export membrane protein